MEICYQLLPLLHFQSQLLLTVPDILISGVLYFTAWGVGVCMLRLSSTLGLVFSLASLSDSSKLFFALCLSFSLALCFEICTITYMLPILSIMLCVGINHLHMTLYLCNCVIYSIHIVFRDIKISFKDDND